MRDLRTLLIINFSFNTFQDFLLAIVICLQCYELLQFFHLRIVIKKMLQFFGAYNKQYVINIEKLSLYCWLNRDACLGFFVKKNKGKLYGG